MCVSCQVEGSEGLERSGRLGAHDDVFDEGAAAIVFHAVVLIDGLVVLDLIERGFVLDLPTASFLLPVDRQIIEAGDQQRIFGEEGNDDSALTRQLVGKCEDAMSSLSSCYRVTGRLKTVRILYFYKHDRKR